MNRNRLSPTVNSLIFLCWVIVSTNLVVKAQINLSYRILIAIILILLASPFYNIIEKMAGLLYFFGSLTIHGIFSMFLQNEEQSCPDTH